MKRDKVLIIRFSSIGDIVLTTPVVRCLKLQRPDIEIHYLTKNSYKILLEENPYIDKIHVLKEDEKLAAVIKRLKKENFTYIIDLHNNIRSHFVKISLGVRSSSFNKLNVQKWLLVNFKMDLLPKVHIVDRYLETAKKFNIKNDGQGLDYFIPQRDKVDLKILPEAYQKRYVAFVIGAKFNTKKLPVHKIIGICREFQQPVILLGGREDSSAGNEIVAAIEDNIYNACGKFNLNQSASLVKQAAAVITHDTGLMHIAAAFNKNIISIWGNTVPEFGMYPYIKKGNGADIRFEIKNLPCRPCSKIGFSACPKKHFLCMEGHDEIEIASAIHKIYN